jgi:hypothetical protein
MHNIKTYVNWILEHRIGRLVPDKICLELKGWCIFGERFNLTNPKTFNEKINWLKIHDRKPEYTMMVDKYEAKKYVSKILGESYIVENYGVWDTFDNIDFQILPEKFVLKCTHDSGGLVICKSKSTFNYDEARNIIEKYLKREFFWNAREWPYKNVRPRIIAEKYLESGEDGLTDYKFYCFNGEPRLLYVSEGLINHKTAKMSFLDINWRFAPFRRSDYMPLQSLPHKPSKFNEMVDIAKKLSEGIPFLRVDLYQIEDKIYFSELTFSPCAGFMPFLPKEYDRKLGDLLNLDPRG